MPPMLSLLREVTGVEASKSILTASLESCISIFFCSHKMKRCDKCRSWLSVAFVLAFLSGYILGKLLEQDPVLGGEEPVGIVREESQQAVRSSGREKKKDDLDCASTQRSKHPGMRRSPRFQFVHIPKTGGTTIQEGLNTWVQGNPHISVLLWDQNAYMGSSFACPPKILTHTFLMGHRGYGFCKDVIRNKDGLFTATAVRSPVSRMVSLYDYNLFKRGTGKAQKFFGNKDGANTHTLKNLIKEYNATTDVIEEGERVLRYSGTQQCRFMCGFECLGPNSYKNETFTPEYLLERALENLRKTDCVAVTEKLNDLVAQLRFHLTYIPGNVNGWQTQNKLPLSMRSTLDEESRAILLKWAWADEQLYQEAAKIAQEKTRQAVRCLGRWAKSKTR